MKSNPLACRRSSAPTRPSITRTARAVAEALEGRRLLSDIVWTNRGLAADNFAATFGANAATARGVVDAAINHWERAIVDFNFASATQYNISISMRLDPTPAPFGNDFGAQTNPGLITVDANGVPTSGTIALGRGTDTTGDGIGDGAGYYLDPTPNDWAEFTTVVNNFAGDAVNGSPAFGLTDLYSLVAHELGHAIGFTPAAGSDWRNELSTFAVDTNLNDTGGAGTLWAYNSATVGRVALTDSDGGAFDANIAPHVARPGQTFTSGGLTYQSNVNVMNNAFNSTGRRHLVNNLAAGMLFDVYGYDITFPEQFGSFYTSLDTSNGILTLRGGVNSNDTFDITSENGGYTISVNIGNDIAGTGPTDAYQSFFADTAVNGIVVDALDGNDTINIGALGSNEPVTINGGAGNDTINLANGDFDLNLASNVTLEGGDGVDRVNIDDLVDNIGNDVYTFTSALAGATFSKPGRTLDFDDMEYFDLDGSPNADVYDVQKTPFGMAFSIDGRAGANVFNLAGPGGDLDDVSGPATLVGGAGSDTLNINDGTDGGNDPYLFDPIGGDGLNFTKPGAPGSNFVGLYHFGMNVFNLEANTGSNLVTIDSLTPPTVNIDLNNGNDTLVVGGDDLDANLSTTSLFVDGGLGTDSLRIDDSDGAGNDTYVFDRTGTTGLFGRVGDPLVVTSTTFEQARLDANGNPNTVRVDGLPVGVDLAVIAGTGGDTLLLGGGDLDTNVLGAVSFDGFLGGHVLVDDDADALGADSYTIDGNSLSKIVSQTHTFANVDTVEVLASNHDDTFNVSDTFGYALTIRGNDGDDDFLIGGNDIAGMASVTVYGGAGADELTVSDFSAAASRTLLVDQTGGLPFVSTFNGNLAFVYDSITEVLVNAGPLNDSITSINVPTGTRLRINGNAGSDNLQIQGHRTLNNALLSRVTVNSGSGDDTLSVNNDGVGSALVAIENSESFASLAISSGGDVRLASGDLLLEVTTAFSMPTTGAELDLRDGRFVRRNNANVPLYQLRLSNGYAGGAWNGDGINSSTAAVTPGRTLGYAYADDLLAGPSGTVSGTLLNANDVFIAYTVIGDANLDRTVNFDDLLILAQNYGNGGTFSKGNFNYDALSAVDFDDLLALAQNYGQSLVSVAPTVPAKLPATTQAKRRGALA